MTPDAAIETGPEAGERRTATAPLRRRLLSMTYEAMLLFAVVFVADYLFDTLTQSRHGLVLRHARQAWLFVVVGAYFIWFWLHGGQTLAMKTWRIRLVRRDGGPVDPARAVARYLLLWVVVLPTLALVVVAGVDEWGAVAALAAAIVLPPFYALVDPDRQFVHDRLLGTRLVVA